MTDQPTSVTFAAFARILGKSKPWVTQLRHDDRLVLTADGKRVLVAESLARVKATDDPAMRSVATRHAAARGQGDVQAQETTGDASSVAQASADASEGQVIIDAGDDGFQYWRRRTEKAKALAAERDNAIAEGKLLDAAQVVAAVAGAITTLRTRLESLADVLGPQLAPVDDESRCRALIAESVQHALEETSRAMRALESEAPHA